MPCSTLNCAAAASNLQRQDLPRGTHSGLYRYLPHHRPSSPSTPILLNFILSSRKPNQRRKKKSGRLFRFSRWPPALRCRYLRPGPFKTSLPQDSWSWFLWEGLCCSVSIVVFFFFLPFSIAEKEKRDVALQVFSMASSATSKAPLQHEAVGGEFLPSRPVRRIRLVAAGIWHYETCFCRLF